MRWLPLLTALCALCACTPLTSEPQAARPAPTDTNLRIADAALTSGSPGMATEILETMLKTDPRNVGALVRLGKAQLMDGKTAAAELTFRRAVATDPSHAEARNSLAKLLLDRNAAEAEPLFAIAAAADPNNTAALNNLGISRDIQGKHESAQEAYRKALALNPSLTSAQENLALSLAFSGRAAEGVTMLTQITNAGLGGRRARDNLAVALALAGETAEATRVLREVLSPADAQKAIEAYRMMRAPAVQ